jgi:hypothetical protein
VSKSLTAGLISLAAFGAAMCVFKVVPLSAPSDLLVWIAMTTIIPVIGVIWTLSYAGREIRTNGLGWQPR